MSDLEKLIVLQEALKCACRWIRENPPAELSLYSQHENYMEALMAARGDPEGKAWQYAFIMEARKNLGLPDLKTT